MRRRHFASAGEAQNRQGARRIPAPARAEHRRVEHRLRQYIFRILRTHELEHHVERKRVLLAQGDHNSVVGGRRLQLEIEGPAKTLAQRQPPGAIDAGPERRMKNELHPAALVEKAFRHNRVSRRKRAQRGVPFPHIFHRLFRAAPIQPALRRQPLRGALSARRDLLPQRRYFLR